MAIAGLAALLMLIALRMPVALAMMLVGAVGTIAILGLQPFLAQIKTLPYQTFANYTLSVIPLFVLMGALAERSGLASELFRAARLLVGHRRGGVGVALVGACTGFGAICGSAVATTATFGRAALPEFRKLGHDPALAAALIAAGGTLGILIPPSVILVVYAIATEQNIARLFMAALVPGLLAALSHAIVFMLIARRHPAAAPKQPRGTGSERREALAATLPVLGIAVAVVGGIYGGLFTPTEAASVGVVLMAAVAILRGGLDRKGFGEALLQTAETSAMIFAILLGAEIFNMFLALTGLPDRIAQAVAGSGWPPLGIIAALLAIYIVLGGVMDELAMLLLTLPVVFPVVVALDLGLGRDEAALWFGVLVLVVVGIGLVAPPIGLAVFVIHSLARDVALGAIYRRVLPFIAADLLRLIVLVAFPGLSLYLVRMLS